MFVLTKTEKAGRVAVLMLLAAIFSAQAFAQDKPFSIDESPLPKPTSPVMDYTGTIDSATRERIAQKIIDFQKSSNPSVEMGVAVVSTTGDRSIFEYSLAVARGWGIGSRDDDNPSLLLFIALDDRKYFTQVSYDLEDELPDGLVGSLQRQYLVPEFKQGNYGKGIEDTIDAYIETIKARQAGLPGPTVEPTPDGRDIVDRGLDAIPNSVCRGLCCLAVIVFLILMAMGNRGGGSGGGGGKRRGNEGFWAAFLAGLASGGGSSSSSGGWSSGGSSGWSGGGGSFGGFSGGGSFGGGGAGGSW